MSATTALLRGRAAAEALMVDEVLVERRTGETTDPDTGRITPTWETVYSGKCKVAQAAASGSPQNVGEATVVASELVLHLPISATGVTTDDRATVTTSTLDPDLAGKKFTIRAPMHKTYATARRLPLQELSS